MVVVVAAAVAGEILLVIHHPRMNVCWGPQDFINQPRSYSY